MKICIIVFIALLTGVNTLSLAQSDIITEEVRENIRLDTKNIAKEVTVEDAILETYVGRYDLTPMFVVSITKAGKQLAIQPDGQGQFKMYPLSDSVFYLKEIIAQITFNLNSDGEVESMTLLQGGQEISGIKLDH